MTPRGQHRNIGDNPPQHRVLAHVVAAATGNRLLLQPISNFKLAQPIGVQRNAKLNGKKSIPSVKLLSMFLHLYEAGPILNEKMPNGIIPKLKIK